MILLRDGSRLRPITKPLALWTSVALVPMVLEQCQHWEPLLALWTSVALLAMVLGGTIPALISDVVP